MLVRFTEKAREQEVVQKLEATYGYLYITDKLSGWRIKVKSLATGEGLYLTRINLEEFNGSDSEQQGVSIRD